MIVELEISFPQRIPGTHMHPALKAVGRAKVVYRDGRAAWVLDEAILEKILASLRAAT
ncbi:hypothetical protein J2S43_003722 [Catenuloplanes nepalensis]|uniref:Transposase n=1 Tax=Catenuloplanes nepalensis TaxID=587533 RepID=A0ABT9MUY8_9ACTN|nr:hypothetical protein [Catenuloplanes nepalensis]MDP9795210.1 hypothetical protein [Catenuloplanes nepalensis]